MPCKYIVIVLQYLTLLLLMIESYTYKVIPRFAGPLYVVVNSLVIPRFAGPSEHSKLFTC